MDRSGEWKQWLRRWNRERCQSWMEFWPRVRKRLNPHRHELLCTGYRFLAAGGVSRNNSFPSRGDSTKGGRNSNIRIRHVLRCENGVGWRLSSGIHAILRSPLRYNKMSGQREAASEWSVPLSGVFLLYISPVSVCLYESRPSTKPLSF